MARRERKPLLFLVAEMDPPTSRAERQKVKCLISSLLRFQFRGDILIWRRSDVPIFSVARVSLHEKGYIPRTPFDSDGTMDLDGSPQVRFDMAKSVLQEANEYSWIIFSGPNVVTLRDIDHLCANHSADCLVVRKPSGEPSEEFFAINSNHLELFLRTWEKVEKADTDFGLRSLPLLSILNEANLNFADFEQGEVIIPFEDECGVRDVLQSSVVLLSGGDEESKVKLSFSIFAMVTFGDKNGTFLDIVDS